MQTIRRGRSPSDHRHAETGGGIGVTLGHRNGVVLVPRAVEADARTVERRGKDRGVVAHQAENLLNAERLDVLDEDLIGRHAAPCAVRCAFVLENGHWPRSLGYRRRVLPEMDGA